MDKIITMFAFDRRHKPTLFSLQIARRRRIFGGAICIRVVGVAIARFVAGARIVADCCTLSILSSSTRGVDFLSIFFLIPARFSINRMLRRNKEVDALQFRPEALQQSFFLKSGTQFRCSSSESRAHLAAAKFSIMGAHSRQRASMRGAQLREGPLRRHLT